MKKRPRDTGSASRHEGGKYADRTHEHGVESESESPNLVDADGQVSSDTSDESAEDTARLRRITSHAPEGVTVVEQRLGHAVGQWIFQVRCDCGRRWFDLKAIDNVQCPRCGLWVHVEVDPRGEG